jgi:hypothetical protein
MNCGDPGILWNLTDSGSGIMTQTAAFPLTLWTALDGTGRLVSSQLVSVNSTLWTAWTAWTALLLF